MVEKPLTLNFSTTLTFQPFTNDLSILKTTCHNSTLSSASTVIAWTIAAEDTVMSLYASIQFHNHCIPKYQNNTLLGNLLATKSLEF